jgi:hypothetical protein
MKAIARNAAATHQDCFARNEPSNDPINPASPARSPAHSRLETIPLA